MALICSVCGKKPAVGNNVSHANNKTKRRWLPNLQQVRAKVDGRVKRMRVCTGCIRSGRIENITDNAFTYHKLRMLGMYPRQVKNRMNIAHHMVSRNDFIKTKLIEHRAFARPSAAPLSQALAAHCVAGTESLFAADFNRLLQQNRPPGEVAVSLWQHVLGGFLSGH